MRLGIIVVALALFGCTTTERVVETRAESVDVTDAERVELDVVAGDLDVVGEAGGESVRIEVDLATYQLAGSTDDQAIDALRVELVEDGDRVVARVSLEGAPTSYYAHVRLFMPSRLALDVLDTSGDVVIADVAALSMSDDSGDIDVRRVPGPVSIGDDSGEIRLSAVGRVDIDDLSGGIVIEDATGDVTVRDEESGDLLLDGVVGDVSIVHGSGEIQCFDIEGDVDITDGSGGIEVQRVSGRVSIRDGSGDIDAIDVGSLEVLSDTSGDVNLR